MTAKALTHTGLAQAEAARRLAADGPNELAQTKGRSWARNVFKVLKEPMLALLPGGGVVCLMRGNLAEAIILLVFACLSIGITVVQ